MTSWLKFGLWGRDGSSRQMPWLAFQVEVAERDWLSWKRAVRVLPEKQASNKNAAEMGLMQCVQHNNPAETGYHNRVFVLWTLGTGKQVSWWMCHNTYCFYYICQICFEAQFFSIIYLYYDNVLWRHHSCTVWKTCTS